MVTRKLCCSTVTVDGAQRSALNQLYFLNGTFVRNRPLYVDALNIYAIFFDGDDWKVGTISYLNEGKLTYGYLDNDQFVDCPAESESWKEYYYSLWSINEEITMQCDG